MTAVLGRPPRDGAAFDDLVPLPPVTLARPVSADAEVLANAHVGDRYWRIELRAPYAATHVRPGQFVMMTVTRDVRVGPVLPRPMAVYDADEAAGTVGVVYSVVGEGTRALTGFLPGERVTVVGPLGRPFDLPARGGVLLLGRGIGTCSLTLLARAAAARDRVTTVVSGRTPDATVGREFEPTPGVRPIAVDDLSGTSHPEALATRLHGMLDDDPPALVAACGSARLEALGERLAGTWGADFQVAVEAHMACGLGYCHGCATGNRTASAEAPLVCRDGPVFRTRR